MPVRDQVMIRSHINGVDADAGKLDESVDVARGGRYNVKLAAVAT